jgi:hypothetical protein
VPADARIERGVQRPGSDDQAIGRVQASCNVGGAMADLDITNQSGGSLFRNRTVSGHAEDGLHNPHEPIAST